ncbi:hypothetical protein V2P20_18225 [Methylobacter sp. Wu1]|uniref:hypothetical protein n=1 Tax=Methylobacter sp. Wu1 TaxID=3119359 RepID=UPI002F94B674
MMAITIISSISEKPELPNFFISDPLFLFVVSIDGYRFLKGAPDAAYRLNWNANRLAFMTRANMAGYAILNEIKI